MMNSIKDKVLKEIIDHLQSMQGEDFKSKLNGDMSPSDMMKDPGVKDAVNKEIDEMDEESPMDMMGEKKPKGLKIEAVEVIGDKKKSPLAKSMEEPNEGSEEEEMSDEELKELLKKML